MSMDFTVPPHVFKALLNVDLEEICKMSAKDIRPVLPCLVRMYYLSSDDYWSSYSPDNANIKMDLLTFLCGLQEVNGIISLLSNDFQSLEVDVKREQLLSENSGNTMNNSVPMIDSPIKSLVFEKSNSIERLRLVSSEILNIFSQIQNQNQNQDGIQAPTSSEFYPNRSDLFDYPIYIPEICDTLIVILSQLPELITIEDITEVLLHVKNGPVFISWIVANFPHFFYDVCTSLIENSGDYEKVNDGNHNRLDALIQLSAMYPCAALVIRAKCVELNKMPALTIMLTLENTISEVSNLNNAHSSSNNDLVTFVLGLLLGNDEQARNWFCFFITQKTKNSSVNIVVKKMRDQFLIQLQNLLKHVKDNTLPTSSVMQAIVLLRLYCALQMIGGIKFQGEEITSLVSLITCFPPSTPEGVRFATMALCLMGCCYDLLAKPENEAKCVQWLTLAGNESSFFGKPTDSTAGFVEMLLLMAIHFHYDQFKWIHDCMCNTLEMKINIIQGTMDKIKNIFTQLVFPKEVVASRSVSLPITPNLNANMSGLLPIHCILQLLKSRVFTVHCMTIKTWIYNQICVSVAPLHPLLPPLIEAFINLIFTKSNNVSQELDVNLPITEEEILKMFGDSVFDPYKNEFCTVHILLLYYLFLYEDKIMMLASHPIKLRYIGLIRYNTDFLAKIPIQHIVQQAKKNRPFSNMFSTLLKHMITHFPYLSQVEDWMEDSTTESQLVPQHKAKQFTAEMIENELRMMVECPKRAGIMLKRLCAEQPINIWPLAPTILKFLLDTLDPNVSRYIQDLYKKVWMRLNIIFPRTLWTLTIKALRHNLTPAWNEDQYDGPLLVLQCDARVYRCPVILSIVIQVLKLSLKASKSDLTRQGKQKSFLPGRLLHTQNQEKLKNIFFSLQDSAAVQLLLDACLDIRVEYNQNSSFNLVLKEVRGVICSFLDQMFINDPSIAKLVHFQGYPVELLPVTCFGIPSMQLCFDFAEELLQHKDLEKVIFSINLISYISQQYPNSRSQNLAHSVINTMQTSLSELTHQSRRKLYIPTLPALPRICQTFPVLTEDCLTFLNRLGRICFSVTTVRSDILLLDTTQSSEEINGQKSEEIICPLPNRLEKDSDIARANILFSKRVDQVVEEILSMSMSNNSI